MFGTSAAREIIAFGRVGMQVFLSLYRMHSANNLVSSLSHHVALETAAHVVDRVRVAVEGLARYAVPKQRTRAAPARGRRRVCKPNLQSDRMLTRSPLPPVKWRKPVLPPVLDGKAMFGMKPDGAVKLWA